MSPYTLVRINSITREEKNFPFVYDAKHTFARDFVREADALLSFNRQNEYHIFVGLPSGLRINLAPQHFNSSSVLEISQIIQLAYSSWLVENNGQNKMTLQFKHIEDNNKNMVFTLSYNPEADA